MARKSGSSSSGGDKYGACDSPQSQVDLKSVLSEESQSGFDVLPVGVQKRFGNRHALRKSWLSNSICLSEHLAQDNEETARKIHMAYESAAKKNESKDQVDAHQRPPWKGITANLQSESGGLCPV